MGASHLTGKTSPLTRHQGSGCGTLSLEWAHLGPEDLSEVNRGGGRGILGGRGRGVAIPQGFLCLLELMRKTEQAPERLQGVARHGWV